MAKRFPVLSDARRELLANRLWEHCVKFIREQRIICPESVYQCDRVIEDAYEFIEGVANITGYCPMEEDEE